MKDQFFFFNDTATTEIYTLFLHDALPICREDAQMKDKRKTSPFLRGAIIGILNPQALPFWVAVIAALKSSAWVSFGMWDFILLFLFGVSLGKLVALLLYGKMSLLIVSRITSLSQWMNRIIGGIFIALALIQGAKMII